ncbi:MAG: GNAT family N-acetyltransferase [Clostridia bacterium]|nr:GNAT family N-acetyltransferase [Clostridia bacterium]
MKITEYFAGGEQERWLNQIKRADWRGGQYLYELLRDHRLKELYGEKTDVLLLTDGEKLLSFCTYAERDDIPDPALTPWVGFVYTFPEYRGKRRMGKLLERAYALAKADGYDCLYICTREEGLYEKYGCVFWKMMKDMEGEDSSVFRLPIVRKDYSGILGKTVGGTIDRPLGSAHPRHPDMIYPINYGYVDGVMAGDGAEQDVYVFGASEPIRTFTGKVVAVLHRLNDCEDKWIVSVDGATPDRDTILRTVDFQEQYYMGELYM